jgi:hypothetical protein
LSWAFDVNKQQSNSKLSKRKEWGFLCGYCHNVFFGDQQQLDDHQNAGKHKMCKGENDKYDKALATERGLVVRPTIKEADTSGLEGKRF